MDNIYSLTIHLPSFVTDNNCHAYLSQLKMGTSTAVVLSNPRVVHKLLHLRSSTTSDRPSIHFNDITSGGLNLVLAPYNNTWRSMRQVVKDMLSHDACMNHLPTQRAEATQLMHDLLVGPAVLTITRYTLHFLILMINRLSIRTYVGTRILSSFR